MVNNNMTINNIYSELINAGAIDVDIYINKLKSNSNNKDVFEDLLFEAHTALMFIENGFSIEMRDKPDLFVKRGKDSFYAEVKHFRMKDQDRIDQANLEAYGGELVPYGDTVPLEGIAAWDQIVLVAIRKIKQYIKNCLNILVIVSSSPNCTDDSIISTSVRTIEEIIDQCNCQGLKKLNGILFISWLQKNITQNRRVYFTPINGAEMTLLTSITKALDAIRDFKRVCL